MYTHSGQVTVQKLLLFLIVFLVFNFGYAQNETSSVRIALFNIWELSTEKLLEVDQEGNGTNEQLFAAARIIQTIKPDILVINEIDHDYKFIDKGLVLNLHRFQDAYLNLGEFALEYPYLYAAPCNTGIPSGIDLNKDGIVSGEDQIGDRNYGTDCFGYGTYPGQYSMGLYSKFPIDSNQVKTFQKFLWKDLPDHHIPPGYYDEEAIQIFRLSSKSHWDIPVMINDSRLHLFLSHPTPPSFDGEEDRNGRRNFDEIKFWVNYLADDPALYDDNQIKGGYKSDDPFLIAGDLNASRHSDTRFEYMTAIDQLLNHPEIIDSGKWMVSKGGWEGRVKGPPDYWERNTAKFGNDYRMQIDYLLPSKAIKIKKGGVFWPSEKKDPDGSKLADTASDHRLVWLEIILP
jgi:alkaline phosphatase D